MRSISKVALAALMFVLAASVSFAFVTVSDVGAWPETWPRELEPLRNQSRTITHDIQGYCHEIPFTNREQFETAWPYIVKVKSNEAPILLLSSPDKTYAYTSKNGEPIKAGVRIRSPLTGRLYTPPEGKTNKIYPPGAEAAIPGSTFLRVGPPWPDYIQSQSGALPEFVIYKDNKWAPYTWTGPELPPGVFAGSITRSRIDIELIVDGDIIDLNRIPLPPNTPIIDKRFKTENKMK